MAESFAVYFGHTSPSTLLKALIPLGEEVNGDVYIPNNENYEIIVCPYEKWDREIDDEWPEIERLLNGPIKSALVIELRRSVQNQACRTTRDVLKKIALIEDGVVVDGLGCVSTISRAIAGKELMAGYIHPPHSI